MNNDSVETVVISERDQKKVSNQKEDKKNVKGMLLMMLAGFVFGMVGATVALGLIKIEDGEFLKRIFRSLMDTVKHISVYVPIAVTVLAIPALVTLYMQAKKAANLWDGEDEDVYNAVDNKLNIALFITSIVTILAYVFMPIGFNRLLSFSKDNKALFFINMLICVGGFFLMAVVVTIAQQRIVNLSKELNPEKQGSVFDSKFQKKWIASCDEAEKKQIHEAAFAAYKAVGTTVVVIWFMSLIGAMMFDIGVMPMIFVGIIWLVQTIAYFVKAMQLNR